MTDSISDKDQFKDFFKEIDKLPPELRMVGENMVFEKEAEEHPIPPRVGEVKVFGYETWDINSILKGNYWRRSIYTTDKLCKLFLKADLNQKKKYLRKKNPQEFNLLFLLIILFGVVIGIIAIIMFMGIGG